MKQSVATLLMLLCLAGGALAEDTPKIEGETNVKPHSLVRLKAANVDDRSGLLWRVYPAVGVDRATTGRGLLEFVAPPGVYEVELLAIKQDVNGGLQIAETRVKVTIGDAGPNPPKPPEPGPKPPVPPVPDDPLAKDLAALYLADASTTKVPDLLLLVELYKQAADLAKSDSVTTLGQLAKQVADAGQTLLPRTRLTALRERIGKYVGAEFGDEDKPLTNAERIKAATVYTRVSKALQQIGGGQ